MGHRKLLPVIIGIAGRRSTMLAAQRSGPSPDVCARIRDGPVAANRRARRAEQSCRGPEGRAFAPEDPMNWGRCRTRAPGYPDELRRPISAPDRGARCAPLPRDALLHPLQVEPVTGASARFETGAHVPPAASGLLLAVASATTILRRGPLSGDSDGRVVRSSCWSRASASPRRSSSTWASAGAPPSCSSSSRIGWRTTTPLIMAVLLVVIGVKLMGDAMRLLDVASSCAASSRSALTMQRKPMRLVHARRTRPGARKGRNEGSS